LHFVGPQILQVRGTLANRQHRRGVARVSLFARDEANTGLRQSASSRHLVVYLEADMVNASQVGGLPHPKLRRFGIAVFQDREIDVAVAEPDAALSRCARPAIEFGQSEVLFVELRGGYRIVSDESDVA